MAEDQGCYKKSNQKSDSMLQNLEKYQRNDFLRNTTLTTMQ